MSSQEIKTIVSNNQSFLESTDSPVLMQTAAVLSWISCDVPVYMSQSDFSEEETNQLTQLLAENRDVFAQLAPEELGRTSLI